MYVNTTVNQLLCQCMYVNTTVNQSGSEGGLKRTGTIVHPWSGQGLAKGSGSGQGVRVWPRGQGLAKGSVVAVIGELTRGGDDSLKARKS